MIIKTDTHAPLVLAREPVIIQYIQHQHHHDILVVIHSKEIQQKHTYVVQVRVK